MLLLQTRYFYANYSLKLEETENSSLIFCPYKNITYYLPMTNKNE